MAQSLVFDTSNSLANLTRPDFPILLQTNDEGKPLVYLDHAATSQKPYQVLEALRYYYSYSNANVHRGAHQLSNRATEAFESAREITARFIGATNSSEIVFTRNATEAINLMAHSWGNFNLKEGDEILLTVMEHHSNLIPWQILAARNNCILRHVGITDDGELDIEDFKKQLNERTKIVSMVHISNVLGCINPIHEISLLAHKVGALILVDACQSLAHLPIDVNKLQIDALVGSSHKLCGPTGVGFLWARENILDCMPPFLGGGEMIQDVFLNYSTWSKLPHKFEAGTPPIGEAIGMGAAINYLQYIGLIRIRDYEKKLTKLLFDQLSSIDGLTFLGPTPLKQPNRAALASFSIQDIHANDIAALLDTSAICIRSGHHCTQPLHRYYGITASARASLSFTTTIEEINFFIEELTETIKFFRKYK
uniref:cysteine desulfurase n=1 Tax=Paulinella chromatophora TaxID=39717 RepID=B1X554_PAUCH|nr:putative cysteine desulfurase or selenocysteine lyase [Paulinella chromatophora]ACB43073.1 putative cysteine desulfurase or selenocysteine lyase [Paulinella chromatophora]